MNASRVAVSRRDFLAGKIDLRETLGGIPAEDVRGMQAVLRAHGRGFQYSLDDDPNDAVAKLVELLSSRKH